MGIDDVRGRRGDEWDGQQGDVAKGVESSGV